MSIETRKLRIIENLLKRNDTEIIDKMESLLEESILIEGNELSKFSGLWSNDEADEIETFISEGCEKIDHADW